MYMNTWAIPLEQSSAAYFTSSATSWCAETVQSFWRLMFFIISCVKQEVRSAWPPVAQWVTEGWELVYLFINTSICIIDIVHPDAFHRAGMSASPVHHQRLLDVFYCTHGHIFFLLCSYSCKDIKIVFIMELLKVNYCCPFWRIVLAPCPLLHCYISCRDIRTDVYVKGDFFH